jgi:hypothetical protein
VAKTRNHGRDANKPAGRIPHPYEQINDGYFAVFPRKDKFATAPGKECRRERSVCRPSAPAANGTPPDLHAFNSQREAGHISKP